MALGAYEVDLLDLTSAYQVFQQDGHRVEPYLITVITNAHGDVLYRHPDTAPVPVFDPQKNRLMVRMMEGVIAHGTGKKAALDRPAAGKTGTSQNWRDAWFVGFTPDWIAGVWVGDDRSRPMAKVAGGELPSEMWRRFMVAAHKGLAVSDFPAPEATPPSPMEAQAAAPAHIDEADEPDAPTPRAGRGEADADAEGREGPVDSRRAFYSGLADDFGQAAGDADSGRDPEDGGQVPQPPPF